MKFGQQNHIFLSRDSFLYESNCVIIFQNRKIIINLMIFHTKIFNRIEKYPKSYNSMTYSPIMDNRYMSVIFLTDIFGLV